MMLPERLWLTGQTARYSVLVVAAALVLLAVGVWAGRVWVVPNVVAYIANDEPNRFSIRLTDVRLRAGVTLAANLRDPQDLAWSPDGTRLVYTQPNAQYGRDICLLDAAQTAVPSACASFAGLQDVVPLWSPDETRLALQATFAPSITPDLYLYDPATTTLTRLTETRYGEIHTVWSPDGTALAYVTDDGTPQIAVLTLATGAMRYVTDTGPDAIYRLAWSAAGGLAYSAVTHDDATHRVLVLDVATGTRRLLRTDETPIEPLVWSPDGTRLAAFVRGQTALDVIIMSANGERRWAVDNGSPYERSLRWSADGTRLAYTSHDGADVLVLDAATGATTRLTDTPGYDGAAVWMP